jgi:5-methylthioadenosine/S-adenosylhomocysteine deaminase
MKADILIKNGYIITMDSDDTCLENGAIAIKNDTITWIGPEKDIPDSNEIIDARQGIIMPGLINTHTHASMTLFRGLADDLPLMTWLHEHIFPAEANLNYDLVYLGSMLACAEMIMSGTTTFCDMYIFEDAVAEAANKMGMRALVGEGLFDFPSPNYGPLDKGYEYTEYLIKKWKDHPLVNIAVEPHSPYLCGPDILKQARTIANDHKVPVSIHLSETKSEVAQIKEKYNKSPVAHLSDMGLLGPDLIAAHCVMVSNNDLSLLRKNNVKVAHNPASNMKLASGIAPVPEMLKKNICVSLGTDGCASNNNLDMFQEMDIAAKIHKVNNFDPTVLDALTVLKMATINGANTLGLSSVTGSLEKGKKADIIIIDTNKPHLIPMYNPISHLVYSVSGSDVVTSIINGKILMKDRELLSVDLNQLLKDVQNISDKKIKSLRH